MLSGFICQNLQLKSAALRDAGNTLNQLPDASFFQAQRSGQGWQKLPSGLIIQWGILVGLVTGVSDFQAPLPIAFPNGILQVVASHDNSGHWIRPTIYNVSVLSNDKIYCSAIMLDAPTVGGNVTRGANGGAAYGRFIAIGY